MYIISILCVIGLIACDQLTKWFAATSLPLRGEIQLIQGVFELSYVENRGAAFGILQGARWFFIPITITVIAAIIFYFVKLPKNARLLRLALILICAGAIGNFIDRAFNGYVVDFLYFSLIDFPVFNFADICVVVGAVLFGIIMIFELDKKPIQADKT